MVGETYVCVAVDGSWQKRGNVSQNGLVSVTSVETGKVLDVAVFSKYCKWLDKLRNNHLDDCQANYSGTNGGIEVASALEIFQRSVETRDVRYLDYYGDLNAFEAVLEAMPYGPDIQINKTECIGHIAKIMGTRLRLLKTKKNGVKLSDGKTLSGKG